MRLTLLWWALCLPVLLVTAEEPALVPSGTAETNLSARSCQEVSDRSLPSGVYTILVQGTPTRVRCDSSQGGGWTRVAYAPAGGEPGMRLLGVDSNNTIEIATGASGGVIGSRFRGAYNQVLFRRGSAWLQADVSEDIFEDSDRRELPLANPISSVDSLNRTDANQLVLCRAGYTGKAFQGSPWAVLLPDAQTKPTCGCSVVDSTSPSFSYPPGACSTGCPCSEQEESTTTDAPFEVLVRQAALAPACQLSPWSGFSACSKPCGGGNKTRTRSQLTPGPTGRSCGALTETVDCAVQECPLDCKQSDWTPWGGCSKRCDGGTQSRYRSTTALAMYGGQPCGELQQDRACHTHACDTRPYELGVQNRDCELGQWSGFGTCSRSCGGGTKLQHRAVIAEPVGMGRRCGLSTRALACNTAPCPTDCLVSQWAPYTPCSEECGTGEQTRVRYTITKPANGGKPCPPTSQLRRCNTQDCPLLSVDCLVGIWSDWEGCSGTCDEAHEIRTRQVTQEPTSGGDGCPVLSQRRACQLCSSDGVELTTGPLRPLAIVRAEAQEERDQRLKALVGAMANQTAVLQQLQGAKEAVDASDKRFDTAHARANQLTRDVLEVEEAINRTKAQNATKSIDDGIARPSSLRLAILQRLEASRVFDAKHALLREESAQELLGEEKQRLQQLSTMKRAVAVALKRSEKRAVESEQRAGLAALVLKTAARDVADTALAAAVKHRNDTDAEIAAVQLLVADAKNDELASEHALQVTNASYLSFNRTYNAAVQELGHADRVFLLAPELQACPEGLVPDGELNPTAVAGSAWPRFMLCSGSARLETLEGLAYLIPNDDQPMCPGGAAGWVNSSALVPGTSDWFGATICLGPTGPPPQRYGYMSHSSHCRDGFTARAHLRPVLTGPSWAEDRTVSSVCYGSPIGDKEDNPQQAFEDAHTALTHVIPVYKQALQDHTRAVNKLHAVEARLETLDAQASQADELVEAATEDQRRAADAAAKEAKRESSLEAAQAREVPDTVPSGSAQLQEEFDLAVLEHSGTVAVLQHVNATFAALEVKTSQAFKAANDRGMELEEAQRVYDKQKLAIDMLKQRELNETIKACDMPWEQRNHTELQSEYTQVNTGLSECKGLCMGTAGCTLLSFDARRKTCRVPVSHADGVLGSSNSSTLYLADSTRRSIHQELTTRDLALVAARRKLVEATAVHKIALLRANQTESVLEHQRGVVRDAKADVAMTLKAKLEVERRAALEAATEEAMLESVLQAAQLRQQSKLVAAQREEEQAREVVGRSEKVLEGLRGELSEEEEEAAQEKAEADALTKRLRRLQGKLSLKERERQGLVSELDDLLAGSKAAARRFKHGSTHLRAITQEAALARLHAAAAERADRAAQGHEHTLEARVAHRLSLERSMQEALAKLQGQQKTLREHAHDIEQDLQQDPFHNDTAISDQDLTQASRLSTQLSARFHSLQHEHKQAAQHAANTKAENKAVTEALARNSEFTHEVSPSDASSVCTVEPTGLTVEGMCYVRAPSFKYDSAVRFKVGLSSDTHQEIQVRLGVDSAWNSSSAIEYTEGSGYAFVAMDQQQDSAHVNVWGPGTEQWWIIAIDGTGSATLYVNGHVIYAGFKPRMDGNLLGFYTTQGSSLHVSAFKELWMPSTGRPVTYQGQRERAARELQHITAQINETTQSMDTAGQIRKHAGDIAVAAGEARSKLSAGVWATKSSLDAAQLSSEQLRERLRQRTADRRELQASMITVQADLNATETQIEATKVKRSAMLDQLLGARMEAIRTRILRVEQQDTVQTLQARLKQASEEREHHLAKQQTHTDGAVKQVTELFENEKSIQQQVRDVYNQSPMSSSPAVAALQHIQSSLNAAELERDNSDAHAHELNITVTELTKQLPKLDSRLSALQERQQELRAKTVEIAAREQTAQKLQQLAESSVQDAEQGTSEQVDALKGTEEEAQRLGLRQQQAAEYVTRATQQLVFDSNTLQKLRFDQKHAAAVVEAIDNATSARDSTRAATFKTWIEELAKQDPRASTVKHGVLTLTGCDPHEDLTRHDLASCEATDANGTALPCNELAGAAPHNTSSVQLTFQKTHAITSITVQQQPSVASWAHALRLSFDDDVEQTIPLEQSSRAVTYAIRPTASSGVQVNVLPSSPDTRLAHIAVFEQCTAAASTVAAAQHRQRMLEAAMNSTTARWMDAQKVLIRARLAAQRTVVSTQGERAAQSKADAAGSTVHKMSKKQTEGKSALSALRSQAAQSRQASRVARDARYAAEQLAAHDARDVGQQQAAVQHLGANSDAFKAQVLRVARRAASMRNLTEDLAGKQSELQTLQESAIRKVEQTTSTVVRVAAQERAMAQQLSAQHNTLGAREAKVRAVQAAEALVVQANEALDRSAVYNVTDY